MKFQAEILFHVLDAPSSLEPGQLEELFLKIDEERVNATKK